MTFILCCVVRNSLLKFVQTFKYTLYKYCVLYFCETILAFLASLLMGLIGFHRMWYIYMCVCVCVCVCVCNYLSGADPPWENKFWSSKIILRLLWHPKFITILITNCNLSHSYATSSNTKPLRCILIILSDIVARLSSGVYSRCTNIYICTVI